MYDADRTSTQMVIQLSFRSDYLQRNAAWHMNVMQGVYRPKLNGAVQFRD
jgi:hypothetical protein